MLRLRKLPPPAALHGPVRRLSCNQERHARHAILNAGRATGELRVDVTAEDIAASLIGIFTVAHPPEHDARASRLLNILMDGLRSAP